MSRLSLQIFVTFLLIILNVSATILIPTIDFEQSVSLTDEDNIEVQGKVDGRSAAFLNSVSGFVTIDDKIDGNSSVVLNAALNVTVGDKIDGASSVTLISGDNINIGGKVDGLSAVVLVAQNDIYIGDKVDGGVMLSIRCAGFFTIEGFADGNNTNIYISAGIGYSIIGGVRAAHIHVIPYKGDRKSPSTIQKMHEL